MKSRVAAGVVVVAAVAVLVAGCGDKKTPGNGMGPTDPATTISATP